MKLFAEYNRLNLTVMVAVFLLSGIVYYFLLNHILTHDLDKDLMEKKQKIEAYASKHATLPISEDLDDVQVFYAQVPSATKDSVLTSVGRYDPEAKKVRGFRQLAYTHAFPGKYYRVTIIKPVEGTLALLRVIVGVTFSTILLIIILCGVINRMILRRLWQPFYEMVAAMRLFTLHKKQLPVFPETEIDEFILLKDQLNATITRVQKECKSLLLLSKIEHNQFSAAAPVNVKEKIAGKVQQLQELWHNNNLTVTTRLQPCTVQMNPELMEILLNNLLNNATRHNIPGGALSITLTPGSLVVENTGQKALDDDRLFRPFCKEAQHDQHHGTGLSVILEICARSGITLKYSFVEQRHIFLLLFPLTFPQPL